MVDKFISLELDEDHKENELLSYISEMAKTHLPIIDLDGMYVSNASMFTFKERFNNKNILYAFKYEDFLKNEDIQSTLNGFEIDSEKFWYLLLFIYDYSCGSCSDTICFEESPMQQLIKLVNTIKDNEQKGRKLNSSISEEAILSLKIKGKKSVTIDNPIAIQYLSTLFDNGYPEPKENILLYVCKNRNEKIESNSVHIWYFAKLLMDFFKNIKSKRSTSGSKESYNKILLISRLVYFSMLSLNENFLVSDDTLKGYFKQYKDYKVQTMNKYYYEQWV